MYKSPKYFISTTLKKVEKCLKIKYSLPGAKDEKDNDNSPKKSVFRLLILVRGKILEEHYFLNPANIMQDNNAKLIYERQNLVYSKYIRQQRKFVT